MKRDSDAKAAARPGRAAIIWSLVALAACAAANIYHYSLQGAVGLYRWNNTPLFRSILISGLIPLTIALLSLPLSRLAKKTAGRIARGIALSISVIVIIGSVGLLAFFIAGPRLGQLDDARLQLVNPSNGISADPVSGLLRLSFSSDPHWGTDTANARARTELLSSVAEYRPQVFFMLGDTVETGSRVDQWNKALADLEAIVPAVPLRPLMGNHDALFGGQYLYRKAFFPASFSSDSGSPYYYSIDAGAATLVIQNLPWGTENFGRRQRTWLEKTLKAADPSKPIIVASHSFFYASGYDDPELDKPWYDHRENIPAVTPLFERYGVDLVVSGHNHYLELLEHNGVRYAVAGAMGGKSDPEPSYLSPASKWIAVGTFGRLDVEVSGSDVALFYRNEKGEVLREERFSAAATK